MTVCLVRQDSLSDQSSRQDPHRTDTNWMTDFQQLAARQSVLSRAVLVQQQAALLGPAGQLARFSRLVREQARQAPVFQDLERLKDRKRKSLAEQAMLFALGAFGRRPPADNPFCRMAREYLCCVIFDDTGLYTLVERYAAAEALKYGDSQYFAKLIATTRNTVERRIVFHGLLEHFDRLLPIEKSIYPLDYRSAQQAHLDHEESLYGKLELKQPISVIFETREPQWLLDHLPELQRAVS
ncbi:hypothetical protein V2K16_26490 [Pseudomonas alliivorans]|uniref:hypothetical protein n=1 Tax=Pseudomonas alliivorans TaxID=2810613 RepID=UPI001AE41CF5|nr:hypothetical protein [Pseudomonas alliivorans]MBP0943634.1 hypothetical protein [Pseudomonas alliivorans]MEE4881844.1 hypothetical protein [Pseudomonas alliivorans]MEE4933230.1 hypothetical protein [Pseudomonas alliivorans]MEE4938482.1 hypothetical protein [Pseudomonas alliivorans]MEE4943656.1 hypothetical protein [Pseudomonas alliivorans]